MSKIFVLCLAIAGIALTLVVVFKLSLGSLLFIGALLACPLLHVWMMRGEGHKH